MIGDAVFDKRIIENATATPEEMEKAIKEGEAFEYKEDDCCISGYRYKGAIYITDIEGEGVL